MPTATKSDRLARLALAGRVLAALSDSDSLSSEVLASRAAPSIGLRDVLGALVASGEVVEVYRIDGWTGDFRVEFALAG